MTLGLKRGAPSRAGPGAVAPLATLKRRHCNSVSSGRTRTDKIGVGAGADIGGTGISCNFIARQYTGPTRQSYRHDHRHVGAMPATPSINRPAYSHLYARRGSVVQLSVPTIQNYQRDALNIIYSSNIITLLYMFRVSSTHLQEDIVVHKQHMVQLCPPEDEYLILETCRGE